MLWLEMYITSISILRKLWFQMECWTGEGVESEKPFMWLAFFSHASSCHTYLPSWPFLLYLFPILQIIFFHFWKLHINFWSGYFALPSKRKLHQVGLNSREALLFCITGTCRSRVGFGYGVNEGVTALGPQFLYSQLGIPVCVAEYLCVFVCRGRHLLPPL